MTLSLVLPADDVFGPRSAPVADTRKIDWSYARASGVDPSTISDQISAATTALMPVADNRFIRWPWPALDRVVEGMDRRHVWYVGGFPQVGKTTLLTSALDGFWQRGLRVHYVGLEMPPDMLRTAWACHQLGYRFGDVATGRYLRYPNAEQMRRAIDEHLNRQLWEREFWSVQFAKTQRLSAQQLRVEHQIAMDFGADVMVIDHVDHVHGASQNKYQASVEVNDTIHELSQVSPHQWMVATQFNDRASNDPFVRMRPPLPQHVFMGSQKEQVAYGMLGLFWPLRPDVTKEEMQAVKIGAKTARDITIPMTLGVKVMKHRMLGELQGQLVHLPVRQGRVVDPSEVAAPDETKAPMAPTPDERALLHAMPCDDN